MKWPTWDQALIVAIVSGLVALAVRRLRPTRATEIVGPAAMEFAFVASLYSIWRMAKNLPLTHAEGAVERAYDIVAVQELGAAGTAVLAGVYPHGHLEPREDGFGLGIAAIKPVAIEPIELPGRSGWVATLEPDVWGIDRPFAVINIHLMNPIDWPWVRSRNERRAQVGGVARYLAERDLDAVIVGDMNSTPVWPEYRMLAELGIDAAKATGTSHRTWAHFLRGPRWIRIDHAFASGAVPLSHEMSGTSRSAVHRGRGSRRMRTPA